MTSFYTEDTKKYEFSTAFYIFFVYIKNHWKPEYFYVLKWHRQV